MRMCKSLCSEGMVNGLIVLLDLPVQKDHVLSLNCKNPLFGLFMKDGINTVVLQLCWSHGMGSGELVVGVVVESGW